jgi:hypothetical protein
VNATIVPPEVAAYLEAVRRTLSDLPPAEQDDLLAEVEASLVEGAREGGPISARLGSPDDFAAELRAAAGLEAIPSTSPAGPGAVREAIARLATDPRTAAVRERLGQLAPIWWIARAYIAVCGVALAFHADWSTSHPEVPRFGSGGWGLAAILATAVLSIWVGFLTRRMRAVIGPLVLIANVALLIAAVPVARHVADSSSRVVTSFVEVPVAVRGLANDGNPVANIYPYSRDGRLLHDVLLYDGAGRPIALASGIPDRNRRVLRTPTGIAVLNAFPIRYFEPRTNRVAHPNAAPRIRIPRIATPPLAAQPNNRKHARRGGSADDASPAQPTATTRNR